jgi:hypothetical protein
MSIYIYKMKTVRIECCYDIYRLYMMATTTVRCVYEIIFLAVCVAIIIVAHMNSAMFPNEHF